MQPWAIDDARNMTPLQRYISEITTDHVDGRLSRRETLRRLGMVGVSAAAASTLIAACEQNRRVTPPRPATPAPTGVQPGLGHFDVRDYGAVGDGVADDTAAIQATFDATIDTGGGVVYLPAGEFKISSAIKFPGLDSGAANTHSKIIVQGCGAGSEFPGEENRTEGTTVILQTSADANGFEVRGTQWLSIRDIKLAGPGSGSGVGLYVTTLSDANFNMSMSNVTVGFFGSHGIVLDCVCMSTFNNVMANQNGGDGWRIGKGGTSSTFNSCWGGGNGGDGWRIGGVSYCSWSGCGADGNKQHGWHIAPLDDRFGNLSLSINGSGAESNTLDGFRLHSENPYQFNIGIRNCVVMGNKRHGYYAGGKTIGARFEDCWEDSAPGAVASILTESPAIVFASNIVGQAPRVYGSFQDLVWGGDNNGPNLMKGRGGANYVYSFPDQTGTLAVQNMAVNAQTGNYTLALSDAAGLVTLDSSSSITVTVPPDSSQAFPVGTRITLSQIGTGQVTIAPGSGVTTNGTPGLKTSARYAVVELLKIGTDSWLATGGLSA